MSFRRALFRALCKSDLNMLRAIRSRGISLAYEPEDTAPAFNIALGADFVDIAVLDWLEHEGVDPAMRDRGEGAGALHIAAGRRNPAAFDWLLKRGLDIDARTRTGETALMLCARPPENADADWPQWGLRDARALVHLGADANLADETGRTALDSACETANAELVGLLLASGARADCSDLDGVTPLQVAAGGGADACVRALVDYGAPVNAKNVNGATALHGLADMAVTDTTPAHLKSAGLLIGAGADLSLIDSRGFTPLVAAAAAGNVPMAAILVAGGAMAVSDRAEALRHAVTFEDADMTGLLLRAGADVNTVFDEDGTHPLHIAAQEGFVHGVRMLLDHGAALDGVNIDGETALLIAARQQRFGVVELLIERGADTRHVDRFGNSAHNLAARRNNAPILRLLDAAATAAIGGPSVAMIR